ncbi:MAG: hypothetical protein NTY94_02770 [Alphaproteobacteria bacterium]|nr:hypothetical protein [Alphaproteobacteria bacterium]
MSFIHGQAQHAATPPNDHAPGLSLAQDLLERLICALFGILIVRQINRILARFEAMMNLWLEGKLPALPPLPKRTAPTTPRPTRHPHARRAPRIRLALATPSPMQPAPATPTPPTPIAPPVFPFAHPVAHPGTPSPAQRPARALPHPPFRFFALQAPKPNCAPNVPLSNHYIKIGKSPATP